MSILGCRLLSVPDAAVAMFTNCVLYLPDNLYRQPSLWTQSRASDVSDNTVQAAWVTRLAQWVPQCTYKASGCISLILACAPFLLPDMFAAHHMFVHADQTAEDSSATTHLWKLLLGFPQLCLRLHKTPRRPRGDQIMVYTPDTYGFLFSSFNVLCWNIMSYNGILEERQHVN